MKQKFETEWLSLHEKDIATGQTYFYLGDINGPLHLEGWLSLPAGTTEVKVLVCTNNNEPEEVL